VSNTAIRQQECALPDQEYLTVKQIAAMVGLSVPQVYYQARNLRQRDRTTGRKNIFPDSAPFDLTEARRLLDYISATRYKPRKQPTGKESSATM